MINCARTLLMNVAGPSLAYDAPGEEFIPPTYMPKRLPTAIESVRRVVFGSSPDRLYLNYRLRELMTLLHTTELEEFVLELDPRVTYWPVLEAGEFVTNVFGRTVTQLRDAPAPLYFVGEHLPDHRLGRVDQQWRVELNAAGAAIVRRQTTPLAADIYEYTTSDGLSSEVPLTGSGLRVRFREAAFAEGGGDYWGGAWDEDYWPEGYWADNAQDAVTGAVWLVRSVVRPTLDLGQIAQTLRTSIGEPNLLAIFGASPAEPYKTFRNLWHDHPQLAYQLGGLLLGIIYRTNELPAA